MGSVRRRWPRRYQTVRADGVLFGPQIWLSPHLILMAFGTEALLQRRNCAKLALIVGRVWPKVFCRRLRVISV